MAYEITTPQRPLISVVVEGYNESHSLGTVVDTVNALKQQDFPLDQVEMVLVGSSAQVDEWKKLYSCWASFFSVKTVEADGAHYYELKNRGTQIASGDIIAFTDSDACPKPSWLSSVVEGIKNGADVVVGPSLFRSVSLGPDTALMLVTASISWGFITKVGQTGACGSFMSHNVAVQADVFRRHQYRTDLGRTCGSPLLYRSLAEAGRKMTLHPKQQVVHTFSWRWWLVNRHFRAGYEVFLVRRLDKAYPNQWMAQMKMLEPLVTMVWHMLLDIPQWFRFSKLLQTGLSRRLALLPIVMIMSIAARGAEMIGMYSTLLAPKAMKRWAESC